jgi:UMF1 family MFS transporter
MGAIADRRSNRKAFVLAFAILGAISTALLSIVDEGAWQQAAMLYGLGSIGFLGGNIFYDALIVEVSTDKDVDYVSGLGYALGYLGGGLLFLVNAFMLTSPETFGLSGKVQAVQVSFLSVAVWWVLFSMPLMFKVKESKVENQPSMAVALRQSFQQIMELVKEIRTQRVILMFLFAYWFYIDGVDTIVVMSVDYMKGLGVETSTLISAILMVQFVAFPFALLFGKLGQKYGPKGLILIAIAIYLGVTVFATQLDLEPVTLFGFSLSKVYVLAFLIASVQGGIQSLSRSFFARIIPSDRSTEYFSFYNMLGKFAAILGPALIGIVADATGNARLAIGSVAVLFLIGGVLLMRVPKPEDAS